MLRRSVIFSLGILALALPPTALAQGSKPIEIREWASSASASSQYGDDAWSAMQATGSPDSPTCGDLATAWASQTSSEKATLTVMYDTPVVPSSVTIYQSYNPGAITGIELIAADGSGNIAVTDSGDPGGAPCPGTLTIDILDETVPVNGVIISLDQSRTGNWNEIDAVELAGTAMPGTEVSLWAQWAEATSQYSATSWNALQATGLPDTTDCGDYGTAWASADSQGVDDLTVYFPHTVIPTQLDVHETYNPGAITAVDLIQPDGTTVPISNSADPGAPCPGVFSLAIDTNVMAIGVVIHLDQTITGNWNEIDAVQITGGLADDGLVRQWVSGAEATSQYGDDSWSAAQATGLPNTMICGDAATAWASETSTGKDSLTLTFDRAVIPTAVHIYQTYNPGAITGIDLIAADGSGAITVTDSADPGNIPCPGILVINILGDAPPVNGVVIHLDQSKIGNWNEIDAVQLMGRPTG